MPSRLSARQEQCVRLTAFRTDKEIAAHLGISEATVKKHVHEACQRLGVNRRKAALALLDQNAPDYPKDPMADTVQIPFDPAIDGEVEDGRIDDAAVASDARRTDGRAGHAGVRFVSPPLRTSATAFERQGERRPSPATARSGVLHPGVEGPEPVSGYRIPPRGPLLRLMVIAVLALVICAVLIAVGGMVSEFHHVVDRLDPKANNAGASAS